jgi:hypothetical protein
MSNQKIEILVRALSQALNLGYHIDASSFTLPSVDYITFYKRLTSFLKESRQRNAVKYWTLEKTDDIVVDHWFIELTAGKKKEKSF